VEYFYDLYSISESSDQRVLNPKDVDQQLRIMNFAATWTHWTYLFQLTDKNATTITLNANDHWKCYKNTIKALENDWESGTYGEDAVINTETTVNLSSSAFSDLCHEDAAVTRYMLIVHSACYTET